MKLYQKIILPAVLLLALGVSVACGMGNKNAGNYSGSNQRYEQQSTTRSEEKMLVTKRSDLRKDCNENSDIIRTLSPGAVVSIVGEGPGPWYRVGVEDQTGCIHSIGNLALYMEENVVSIELQQRLFDEDYLLDVLRRGIEGRESYDRFVPTSIKALADLKSERAVDLISQYMDLQPPDKYGNRCDSYHNWCRGYKMAFDALKQIGTPQAKQKLADELVVALDRRLDRARVSKGNRGFVTDVRPVADAEAGGKIFAELGELGAYDVVDGMTRHFFQALTFCTRYNAFEYPYPSCSDYDVSQALLQVANNSEQNKRKVKEFLAQALIDINNEPFIFLEKHRIVDDPEIRGVFYRFMADGAEKRAREILQKLDTRR